MAIFHLSMKTISRAKGRSATAAAAYRSGSRIRDDRTGLLFDYRKKRGVDHTEIIAWSGRSEELWNAAEQAEKRKNSCVAREVEFSLPVELDRQDNINLARNFCSWVSSEYNVAGELALHFLTGDNPHCHFLFTTRVHNDGRLMAKTRILDDRSSGPLEVEKMRSTWQKMLNTSLVQNSPTPDLVDLVDLVDHRSFTRRGLNKTPGTHKGHNRRLDSTKLWLARLGQELLGIQKEIASILSREYAKHKKPVFRGLSNGPKI